MLLHLTTAVLCLSTISSALPAAIKPRDVVLREATPEPGTMAGMSESLDYVKPREASAKASENLEMMSESLDYVKPREASAKASENLEMMSESLDYVKPREAKAEPEPGTMAAMSESLEYVRPREASAKAEPETESLTMMSESLDNIKVAS